jgi:hypothetical protein
MTESDGANEILRISDSEMRNAEEEQQAASSDKKIVDRVVCAPDACARGLSVSKG